VYDEFATGGMYPRPEDAKRLERYRVARCIRDGRHADLPEAKRARLKLRGTNRTAGPLGLEGEGIVFFVYNLPSLIVRKRIQLQMLQTPLVLIDDKDAEKEFRIELRDGVPELWARIKDGLEDSYWYGDGLLTVTKGEDGGPLDVRSVDPSRWYPVIDPNDPLNVLAHQVAWIEDHDEGGESVEYLRVDVCYPGRIERRAFRLKAKTAAGGGGQEIAEQVDLGLHWQGLAEFDEAPELDGLMSCVHLPNGRLRSDSIFGRPEFSDSEGLIHDIDWRLSTWSEANDRVAHQAEIVDKAWLGKDENGATYTTNPYHRQFVSQSAGRTAESALPAYREYKYQADALEAQFNAAIMALLIRHETAPALLGLESGRQRESGEAKALGMSTTEARAREDLIVTAPRVNRLLTAAARLSGRPVDVSTHWRVGLPKTESQMLQEVLAKKNAGLMTKKDMLEALEPYLTDEQIEARLAELEAEREADWAAIDSDFTARMG